MHIVEGSLIAEVVNVSLITAVVHLGEFSGIPELGEVEVVVFSAVKTMIAAVVAAAGVFVATATESVGQITVDSLDQEA